MDREVLDAGKNNKATMLAYTYTLSRSGHWSIVKSLVNQYCRIELARSENESDVL